MIENKRPIWLRYVWCSACVCAIESRAEAIPNMSFGLTVNQLTQWIPLTTNIFKFYCNHWHHWTEVDRIYCVPIPSGDIIYVSELRCCENPKTHTLFSLYRYSMREMCRTRAQNTRLSMIKCWRYGILWLTSSVAKTRKTCTFYPRCERKKKPTETKTKTIGIEYIDHFWSVFNHKKLHTELYFVFFSWCDATSETEKSIYFFRVPLPLSLFIFHTKYGL